VSAEAGAEFAAKLFRLPAFLREDLDASAADLVAGLEISGHFLLRYALAPHGQGLPPARVRLYERWRKSLPSEPARTDPT
jgi:DNA repair protein RecO (recombination protein O)